MSDDDWPEVPRGLSSEKEGVSAHDQALLALYTAKLGDVSARHSAHLDALSSQESRNFQAAQNSSAVEDRRRDAVLSAYLDVSKAVLDRMLKRAELIASASASVAAAYGVILGIAFSIDKGTPLPARGLVPVIFLGIALALIGLYVGFVGNRTFQGRVIATGSGAKADQRRLSTFIAWVNATALSRAWALRLAIISLALGILTLPIAFIDIPPAVLTIVIVVSLVAWTLLEIAQCRVRQRSNVART